MWCWSYTCSSLALTPTMPGHYVHVVFKLHGLPESLQNKEGIGKILPPRICIFGSIPELGAWNFQKHVKASASIKYTHWEARVLIPAGSSFEWTWIILNNRCTKILFWDPCRRNTSIGSLGGTIHVAWGRPTQAFRSNTCDVEVCVKYYCNHGQYLVLTGGEPSLGNWDPQQGVEAREEFPPGSGHWKCCLVLEKTHNYQWKWVVVEGRCRKIIRWEDSANHLLTIDEDIERLVVEAPWEGLDYVIYQNNRLRPYVSQTVDDVEISSVLKNHQGMEEMNGRQIEKGNQPRRRRVKILRRQISNNANKDQIVGIFRGQGKTSGATNVSKVEYTSRTVTRLLVEIFRIFTIYLDLVEG